LTTISAKVIADSINPNENRLTTLEVKYPRWIHAEGRTHRLLTLTESECDDYGLESRTPSLMEDKNLSRNAASSRAIPVSKQIAAIRRDPAVPLFWGANQKGMQAVEECNEIVRICLNGELATTPLNREDAWLEAMNTAIRFAEAFDAAGYHKQIVNRLIEPFSHITVLVSATEWSNFFGLRIHDDAEPHIHLLAERMRRAIKDSTPVSLQPGEWHLPYIESNERLYYSDDDCIAVSVARCASLSYKTVDGQLMTPERAKTLYDKLVGAQPLHASPAEHVACADQLLVEMAWEYPHEHGNFIGFRQHRKMLPNECL
jgi:hypothetical protein